MADSLTLTRENQKLRSENQELTVQTNELTIEVRQLAIKLEVVNDELAKIKSRFFGRASEKLSVEERQQMRLFDEAVFPASHRFQTVPRRIAAACLALMPASASEERRRRLGEVSCRVHR